VNDPIYLSIQSRGTVALPADLRRRYQLDRPGTQLEVRERPDGVIELRAVVPVPADQAWFWSSEWQAGERRVDDHVSRGEVRVSNSAEEFLSELDTARAPSRRRR
jgi:bifunctional DNA-binding transcriptional regulator/antitoxin component of YhaV-PrlF toxin-antitoxin module